MADVAQVYSVVAVAHHLVVETALLVENVVAARNFEQDLVVGGRVMVPA